jgi:hypothetical protein
VVVAPGKGVGVEEDKTAIRGMVNVSKAIQIPINSKKRLDGKGSLV